MLCGLLGLPGLAGLSVFADFRGDAFCALDGDFLLLTTSGISIVVIYTRDN